MHYRTSYRLARTALVCLLLTLFIASRPLAEQDAKIGLNTNFCYPPHFGTIVPGITEDRDVVRLLGKGLFTPDLGHVGGRYYTDLAKSHTLIVSIGVDNFIESVTIQDGLEAPEGQEVSDLPVAEYLSDVPASTYFANTRIVLGMKQTVLEKNLIPARKETYDSGKTSWFFEPYPCGDCYASAEIILTFKSENLVSITFYNGC